MKVSCFLVVKENGTVRLTKYRPNLVAEEVSVKINLQIPDAAFYQPLIQATVVVPESAVKSDPIAAEVQENVRELIEQATGLKVTLTLENPNDEQ